MGAASAKGREQRQRMAGPVHGGVPVAGKVAETHSKFQHCYWNCFLSKGCTGCLSTKDII